MEKELKIYAELLQRYISTLDERFLYRAEQISNVFIKSEILPAELIKIHKKAMKQENIEISEEACHAMDFLLEAMIAYGVAYTNYNKIKEEQLLLKNEIQIAANMQLELLGTKVPTSEYLDIGVISIPFNQMNGDYFHFIQNKAGRLGVAIADVVGKGVPAALSMSMIKYSLDSIGEADNTPKQILKQLNRVVEQNIASNMFITMFYLEYNPTRNLLTYSSAGHEPGFLYDAESDTFTEIEADGLVLGVLEHTDYTEYQQEMKQDDFVVLLTDGVTECKYGNRFITREEVLEVIRKFMYLSPENHVAAVYNHFKNLDAFELKDDFTLIILRKK